jgi:hypothetical protein
MNTTNGRYKMYTKRQALLKIMEGTVARYLRRMAASTPSRNSYRSIPQTFYSSAVGLFPAWKRSSRREVAQRRLASGPGCSDLTIARQARYFARSSRKTC